ncbi:PAS domain S-box protein [Planctomyces sp. SH-PL14]|uniref:PAS domain S-box protein n=1 Tax=Planctomyces sp. SH-PL14 TaxID=1632864 RepID=UPI00078B33BD|nr:PAS domain S-box protein [Planctomyces sp. SH-PL14]AMV17382.1 Autoinducer 2 sensor kinase/phosphatase LuxQ [Planctomyces sp. SH-PL14]
MSQPQLENPRDAESSLLRLLVENVTDYAIFVLDPNGRVATWNPGAERIKGYKADEIIGQHFSKFYPQDVIDRGWPEQELRVATAEGRFEDEGWRLRKDGSQFWANVVITTLKSEQGKLIGFSKITRDLTARKQAEENARRLAEETAAREVTQQERERLRVTLASIGDAVISTDAQGRVEFLNTVAEELVGWKSEEATGTALEDVFRIVNENTREPVENPALRALRDGKIVGLANHTVLISRNGTEYPIDDSAAPIRDSEGRIFGSVLVFREIGERRRKERELQASEARKSAVLETALDAIITMNHQGQVVEFNPAAEKLFGYRREEIVGQELAAFIVPPSLREQYRQGMARYLATGKGRVVGKRLELPALRADGTEFPVEMAINHISNDGSPLFTAYLRDISERQRGERQRNARLAVTQALTASTTAAEGSAGVLKAVGEHLNWDVGLLWAVTENGSALACRSSWHHPDVPVTKFERDSCSRTFRKGEGLPGRVWATGKPAWILDVATDTNFPRIAPAAEEGLHSAFACPVMVEDRLLAVIEFFTRRTEPADASLLEMMGTVAGAVGQFLERRRVEEGLWEQTANAETLLRIGRLLSQELDLQRLVQIVTDESTQLCGAQFGAFFYNVVGEQGEAYTLYTISGVPREAFDRFPMPRNTAIFSATFRGEGVVRLSDVTQDDRYGKSAPHYGMPEGHLPVKSYLAVPVVSRTGEVLGGLFFGHADAGVFTIQHERLLVGIAGHAAIAIDNARLHQRTQAAAERLNLALNAADLGDWSWDAASDVVTFSDRAAEVFGIPPGPHMTWAEMQRLLHEDDRVRARREVERVIVERAQYDIEYRVNRKDGSQVWIGVLGRAIYDAADQVVGMHGVVQDVTDRKRLEESFRTSEARFRGLMEQAPFSVQVFSPDGRTIRVNRAWEELWGVTLEQIDGYNVLEDWQLEAKGVLPFIQRAFAGEPSFIPAVKYDPNETIPNQTRHEDPVRWVAAVAYPLKDDSGAIQEVVLVHDNITARREAETALRESEERLRLALEAGRMGVWDWNVRTGELQWSDSLEPLHGLAPGTFGGTFEHFQQLVHPDDREAVQLAIRQALENGGEFYTEFRNLRQNGAVHWIAGSGKVFYGDDGQPLRMIGIGLDVTPRKRSEKTARFLADASAALAVLVDFDSTLQKLASLAVPHFADWVAVDVLEETGSLRRVAVAHVETAKVQLAHEIHGRFSPDPSAPGGVWSILRTSRAEIVPVITDDMLVASIKDDELLRIMRELGLKSYIGVPLTVRGKTLGVLTFIVAESDHIYDETDLAVAKDLADRAAIAIENTQLYRELRDADRRKDEFLAMLAHELRNPLAPIRNGLQVLRLAGGDGGMVEEARTMMERQLTHMVRLVDDLLDVSRITRNKLELRKERVSLAAVIHSAVETSRPLIEQSGHTFSVMLTPVPVHLDADPVRLAQVFSNLLNNAAKYTEPRGRITLTAETNGTDAIVRISDNGLGIPAEAQPRIFEMFSQVDRNMERAQGGLGIGLTLVRRLTEMHGGTVGVKSEGPGSGSEFTVRIPVLSENPEGSTHRGGSAGMVAESRRRILVVDDNRDAAESLGMMLRLMGHEIRTAGDGPAAIEAAEIYRPEMILMDIGLPKLNGYEACRRIRDQAWSHGMVIVALTGWGQEEDRRRSQEAGFDHHLVKPVDMNDLSTTLNQLKR